MSLSPIISTPEFNLALYPPLLDRAAWITIGDPSMYLLRVCVPKRPPHFVSVFDHDGTWYR